MTSFLLDTNVLSESSRQVPHPKVLNWLTSTPNETLFTSILALAEIRLGIELLDAGKKRAELERWFEGILLPSFLNRIFPVTQSIGDQWAVLYAPLQRKGRKIGIADGLLAATAVEHGLTIVTRDVNDFNGFGVPIINPWES